MNQQKVGRLHTGNGVTTNDPTLSPNDLPVSQFSTDEEERAKAILEAQTRNRVEACKMEMQALLLKHKCKIDVSVILRQGQVIPQFMILPNEQG